ncbi:MAG: glycosyltransferase family 2 protein [Chloroflexota bacterium]
MAEQNPVAIVVLNWNGFDDTVQCLTSLRQVDYPSFTVVLVDNGSDHDEGKRLGEMFPEVHLIANAVNRGFAGGNNDGMRWALANGFEWVVNLNNDCTVEPDWLSKLVSGVASAAADYGSSRIMFHPDRSLICSDGDAVCPDGSAVAENRGREYGGWGPRRIISACGAGSIYSARCLKAAMVHGDEAYDELYFAYYEDADLGMRLTAASFKGVSVPDAVLYHKHSRSSGDFSRLKVFHSEKNRMLNELLDFPIYFLPVAESFFAVKVLSFFVSGVLRRRTRGAGYLRNVGALEMLAVFVRARLWILAHAGAIAADRRERKRKGLLSRRVLGVLCWDLSRIVR